MNPHTLVSLLLLVVGPKSYRRIGGRKPRSIKRGKAKVETPRQPNLLSEHPSVLTTQSIEATPPALPRTTFRITKGWRRSRDRFHITKRSLILPKTNSTKRFQDTSLFRLYDPYRWNFRDTQVIHNVQLNCRFAVLQHTFGFSSKTHFIRTLEPQFPYHERDLRVNLTDVRPVQPLYRYAAIHNTTIDLYQPKAYLEILCGPHAGAIFHGETSWMPKRLGKDQSLQLSFRRMGQQENDKVAQCLDFDPQQPKNLDLELLQEIGQSNAGETYLLLCLAMVLAKHVGARYRELQFGFH